uniref:DEK_C domain-containing protein n=1 Tax=Strongyloides stercoralis TaxID=6248 RepID=A0A0K0E3G3_STRER
MNKKELTNDKKSHLIYGGFRATIPHLLIENNLNDYSEEEINEMYMYINDKLNPFPKKREESIADIHIDRVFKRKCMRGVEKFLNIEYQLDTCDISNEVPCKKVRENDDNGDKSNANVITKNDNCIEKDNNIVSNNKSVK